MSDPAAHDGRLYPRARRWREVLTVNTWSLTALADEHLAVARATRSGRSAHTVHGGHEHALRQTLITLTAGAGLAEHNSPGEATLQVLRGRVQLSTATEAHEGAAGDLLVIPAERHALTALDDSAVLLTVALRPA
jgi:quercetin dioxygenase-like cupin family protein